MPIRLTITKWHGYEATKIANLLAGNSDANHVYVLMAKLQQMLGMGRYTETEPFFAAIERQFTSSNSREPQAQQRYQQAVAQLRLQNAIVQMAKFDAVRTRQSSPQQPDLFSTTRACMEQLLESGNEHFPTL